MPDSEVIASYQSSRLKWVFLLISSLPFVAIGIWLASTPPDLTQMILGYMSILLFGATALASIICLVHPDISSLKITRKGLAVRTFWHNRFYRWEQIESFGVEHISTQYRGFQTSQAFVGVNFSPKYDEDEKGFLARLNEQFGKSQINRKFDKTLPDSYGTDPEQLAEKLNKWRDQSIEKCKR